MTADLRSRIALITGASAGIGEACARELAALGASVVLNARRAERLDSLVHEINSGMVGAGGSQGGSQRVTFGGPLDDTFERPVERKTRAVAAPGDAADEQVIESMFGAAERAFGRAPDIVVINAGRGLRGSPLSSDPAQWEEMVRINLVGAARLLRAAAERMLKDASNPAERAPLRPNPGAKGGARAEPAGAHPLAAEATFSSPAAYQQAKAAAEQAPKDWPRRARDIVLLSSTVGRHISPFSSMYGATKFGVTSMGEAARRELAPRGVRVSCVHPGVVRSEFQEAAGYDPKTFGEFMDRIGPTLTPEDVARTIGFIVSQPPEVCINDVMLRPTRQEYP